MLLGYMITAAVTGSFLLILAFLALERKELARLLLEHVDRYSLAALALVLIFFLAFSILKVSPVEQLYFDENIYQAIAINVLQHGNALWCQFGTGYLRQCYLNQIYHDPVGWAVFIAAAFALFGIGIQTAYGLELLAGTLSILFVFLLASVLVKRRGFAVLAASAFALMPQLFIWSRTEADLDLPFMMFATLAFFFFVAFTRKRSLNSLALFAFSLALVSYMRIEAILLTPIFAVLLLTMGEKGVVETVKERAALAWESVQTNTKALVLLLVFILLLLPQLYYISLQAQNPSYGQPANESVLSLANFNQNIKTNLPFIFGEINGTNIYPTAFHYAVTPLAIIGAVLFALDGRYRNRFGILLMLLIWFFAYFLFYTAFYAGSATYGVDSRFMLQLLPSLCILAAFAILELADLAGNLLARRGRDGRRARLVSGAVAALLFAGLLVVPFAFLYKAVTLAPQNMPQQGVIYPAINFFNNNYKEVPQNCLVFTFTPDIWVEVNRSAAQIGYLSGSNSTVKALITQNSCLVLDYGYWCVVPPYHSSLCSFLLTRYKLQNLTPYGPNVTGTNVTFYRILNYT